jgi:hypothetical protein
MYDEKQKKGGTHCLGLPHGRLNGGARVSNVLGCICKDGVGTITYVYCPV